MADTTTKYPFSRPTLTAVTGKPDAASLCQLSKELYANARAVHSEGGGGKNGQHLGIVMPMPPYVMRTMQAFVVPVHPGVQPNHPQPQLCHDRCVQPTVWQRYPIIQHLHCVAKSLKQQILAAVASTYYQELDDDKMGMADVTPQALLAHLTTTYGTLCPSDLLANQAKLAETWNPEQPIQNLWTCITTVRAFAIQGGARINGGTATELTLLALQTAGTYEHLIDTWNDKSTMAHTSALFKEHVTLQETTRLKTIKAKAAGYHAANGVIQPPERTDETLPAATPPGLSCRPRWTQPLLLLDPCANRVSVMMWMYQRDPIQAIEMITASWAVVSMTNAVD
jgi:hypothetical protein